MRTPKLPEVPADEEAPARSEEKAGSGAKPALVDPPRKKNEEEDEFEALAKRFEALKKR